MQTRVAWENLTDHTRAAIETQTGRVHEAHTVSAGMNSALAVVLDTEGGKVFVKGIRRDHPGVVTQQREAAINPYVRSLSPAVLWQLDDVDGWNVLGFEYIEGRAADYRPGSADLPLVLDALGTLGSLTCPNVPSIKESGPRWSSYVDSPDEVALLAGDALLHTDYNPENVLVSGGAAHLIDWAWPTRGAAWIDPCCLLIRMVAAGHSASDAEGWVRQVPAWHTAPEGALAVFARACARMWQDIADQNPQPWVQGMARAAREWADVRLTGTCS
ncbi:MAG: hypothetical protein ABW215_06590 [Kibdelosporangium sp.]